MKRSVLLTIDDERVTDVHIEMFTRNAANQVTWRDDLPSFEVPVPPDDQATRDLLEAIRLCGVVANEIRNGEYPSPEAHREDADEWDATAARLRAWAGAEGSE